MERELHIHKYLISLFKIPDHYLIIMATKLSHRKEWSFTYMGPDWVPKKSSE